MPDFVCSDCGTKCSTPKQGEIPQSIYWNDGHCCNWVEVQSPEQVQILQLSAEIEELKQKIGFTESETLRLDNAGLDLLTRLNNLEQLFRDTLGEKILEKYG